MFPAESPKHVIFYMKPVKQTQLSNNLTKKSIYFIQMVEFNGIDIKYSLQPS